jgi:hypothetical protein
MNFYGINDISMTGKLYISNISHQVSGIDNYYIIANPYNSGGMRFQLLDSTEIARQLVLDQYINMKGVNDLYCKRLFINNTLFNPSDFTTIQTNTRQIYSYSPNQTSIEYSNGRFLFLAGATSANSSYNSIIQAGDNALIGYNISLIIIIIH